MRVSTLTLSDGRMDPGMDGQSLFQSQQPLTKKEEEEDNEKE